MYSSKFKIRASACGKIMTMPRAKKAKEAGELSQTAKTYCETWLKEQLYARRKTFTSKYTEKGNAMEKASIDFLGDHWGMLLLPNEKHYSNDYATGLPDIVLSDKVPDIKNAWDCFTFPLFETELKNKDYYYQMQVYMWLTGRKKACVVYVLSDAPEHLIDQESRRECYRLGIDPNDGDIYDATYNRMTYADIPDDKKIKVFDVEYDESVIEAIKERVEACRKYISKLEKTL